MLFENFLSTLATVYPSTVLSPELLALPSLYYEGNYEKIYQLIDSLPSPNSSEDIGFIEALIKAICQNKISKSVESCENCDQLIKTWPERLKNSYWHFELLMLKAKNLRVQGQLDDALLLIKEALNNLNQSIIKSEEKAYIKGNLLNVQGILTYFSGNISEGLQSQQEAILIWELLQKPFEKAIALNNLGNLYALNSDNQKAMESYQESLEIRRKFNNLTEIAQSINNIGTIYYEQGDLDKALEYYSQSLQISRQLGNKLDLAVDLQNFGDVTKLKGALEESMNYYKESLSIYKGLHYTIGIANCLENLGIIERYRGNFSLARDYFLESYDIKLPIHNNYELGMTLFRLIEDLLDLGDSEKVKLYFDKLDQIIAKEQTKYLLLFHRVSEALILKSTGRFRDLGQAIVIFEDIIGDEIVSHEVTVTCLINLCEILLAELKATVNEIILDEISAHINLLLKIAEEQHSQYLFTNTYHLQAQIALVKLDLDNAREKFSQAQKLAEQYGLFKLARQISNDHDKLLEQLDLWRKYVNEHVPIVERIKLASLNPQIARKVLYREFESPDEDSEIPVFLTIIRKSGASIYNKILSPLWKGDETFFGGFLTAFNSFSNEFFSEKLDRAKLGEFLLLMKNAEPFTVCYVIKHHSYLAQQKLFQFTEKIRSNTVIWEKLLQTDRVDGVLSDKISPELAELVKNIFLSS